MKANIQGMVRFLNLIRLYCYNFLVTVWRYLLICWKSIYLFWQQQRLRQRFARLGENIFTSRLAGDPNPLLQETVKDQLEAIRVLYEKKMIRREDIQGLRQQIKATSYSLPKKPEEGKSNQ